MSTTARGNPANILDLAFERASTSILQPIVNNLGIVSRIEYVCRNRSNRACSRFLLACTLAKSHNPAIDIRKPYTEIGGSDTYSGRYYDEHFIGAFVMLHDLPCNTTTAFLTPGFRTKNMTLTPDIDLGGRPAQLYQTTLSLLTAIYEDQASAGDVLAETIRWLLIVKDERLLQLQTMLASLKSSSETIPLSSEAIVTLIGQHLKCQNASRLPVLVVAAAYQAASDYLGERYLPLEAHNAADIQTGSLGDLQIALVGDDNVITAYEMKMRRVTIVDIDLAIRKVNRRIDNYIFITTEEVSEQVKDYAASIYGQTGGIEFVILDCIGFIRHFLHLFYRLRIQFLDVYQELVIKEPESAVRQELKEAFLALRLAAESAGIF